MKRTRLFALMAALLLSLTACAKPDMEDGDSYPTLPDFSQEQTPLEQLEDAYDTMCGADTSGLRYGFIRENGDGRKEETFHQTLSGTFAPDWGTLYQQLPEFPDNREFLADFCSQPLRVIPSNTGTVRYELTELSRQKLEELLYDQPRDGSGEQAVCSVALEIDAGGRLHHFEMTINTEQESLKVFLTVIFTDSP